MIKPYVIQTPRFTIDSGGIRVMWGLYGHLLAKGQVAFTNESVNIPSVGIYPEIYHGNDLNATKVIRYILQKPGMMGHGTPGVNFQAGPTSFPPDDEIYVFSRVYDEWGVDDDHVLFLPILDLHIYKDQGRKRNKVAFFVGKGVNREIHPKEAVELTRQFGEDQQAQADFLNECETLYVYDRMSAVMEVARLCGCKVVYLGELPLTELLKYEPGVNGLGFRKEEKLDTGEFRNHYKGMIKTFSDRLDTFIDHTQA